MKFSAPTDWQDTGELKNITAAHSFLLGYGHLIFMEFRFHFNQWFSYVALIKGVNDYVQSDQ